MKASFFLIVTILMSVSSHGVTILPNSISEAWSGNQVITDNQPSGVAYVFNVSTFDPRTITGVSVDLNIAGGWNGDLYAYLSHDAGFSVLLNRIGSTAGNPGGSGASGINVRLQDAYLTDIHTASGPLSGNFAPDGRNANPFTVLDTDPRDALLNNFTGLNPNGTWTLFFSDVSPLGTSTLQSWTITVATVPEPGSAALAGLAILFVAALNRRSRQKLPTSGPRRT